MWNFVKKRKSHSFNSIFFARLGYIWLVGRKTYGSRKNKNKKINMCHPKKKSSSMCYTHIKIQYFGCIYKPEWQESEWHDYIDDVHCNKSTHTLIYHYII